MLQDSQDLGKLSLWLLKLGSEAKSQGSGLAGYCRTVGSGMCIR